MSDAVCGSSDQQDASGLCSDIAVRKRRQPRKDYAALSNPQLDGDTDEATSDDNRLDDTDVSDLDENSDRKGNSARICHRSSCIFTCVICFAGAYDKRSHLDHLAAAHPNMKTHCLACESQYDNYTDYTQHLRDCHPRLSQSIDKAEGGGTKSSLYCLECGKGFDKRSYLYQHRAQHFMLNRIPCDVCGKSFLEGAMMERHLETHREATHKCSRCLRTFRSAVGLARHERAHQRHKQFCSVCGTFYQTAIALEVHICTWHRDRKDRHCCSLCQKEYSNPDCLRQHMTHKHGSKMGGEPSFSCHICDRRFRWKSSLKMHAKLHEAMDSNANVKVFKCRMCGQICPSQCSLKAHMIKHSDRRQFPCEICGIAFKRKYALKEHCQAVHCSEKNFQCSTCGQTFVVKRYLDAHFKQAHIPGLQSFTCSSCPKVFKTEKSLKSHWRSCHGDIPKDHICDICTKAFVSFKDLKRHALIHGGDRKYECKDCGSAFYRVDNLRRHQKQACKYRDL
ncbi:zinc finger protein 711-like isoform X3 [Dermacentor variabilis]|uniref:zinc finger protein 711-like isoform X3 n=1 Tax=Dermacentor variabilis TaxID=34621 RepID=UPI003F5C55EB